MNLETKITLGLLFAVIAAIANVYAMMRNKKADTKQDTQQEVTNAVNVATQYAQITVKLDNFGQKLTEMQRSSEKTNEKLDNVTDKIARQDERINSLVVGYEECRRRLDQLENK